ncbi:hypothetical protein LP420_10025 [Massilia sp. B-10]|nr:hypothetical protein LP420_10025 [Massilia sp. B-10]
MLLGLAIMASPQAQETAPAKDAAAATAAAPAAKAAVKADSAMTRTQCDVYATVQQCCGAKKCGGNVLSNHDAHNCGRTVRQELAPRRAKHSQ